MTATLSRYTWKSLVVFYVLLMALALYVAFCQPAHAETLAELNVTPRVAQAPTVVTVTVKLHAHIIGDGCIHINAPEAGDEDVSTDCVPLGGLQTSTFRRTYRLRDPGDYYIWLSIGRAYRTSSQEVQVR